MGRGRRRRPHPQLLLTFFYRQMPELIERGHLFIAQPPLYKVAKGRSEQYLKDERAMEDYLAAAGTEDAVLTTGTGESRGGQDLIAIVARRAHGANPHRRAAPPLRPRGRRAGGDRGRAVTRNARRSGEAAAAVTEIARRLDAVADEAERGWTGEVTEAGYRFARTVRGVREVADLDGHLLATAEARRLERPVRGPARGLRRARDLPPARRRGAGRRPPRLVETVRGGRKGLSIQRYKGLGEMNPEQLWETTLDRNVRSLLQVRIRETDDADDVFTKLMGDVVEPRREFIVENALRASVDA